MEEKLIEFLKLKIQYCEEEIEEKVKASNLSEYDILMNCYKLACKIEAYNELIEHLNAEIVVRDSKI